MIMNRLLLGCVLLLAILRRPLAADEAWEETVRPFLQTYCAACHGGEKPEEGLSLESREAALPIEPLRDPATLELMAERLRSQTMPPAKAEKQPPAAEREAVLDWLEAQIDAIVGTEKNPGRVTIRRLTRVDYRNTIRDLLGVQYDTSGFPSDDIAYGFDNLADVISLPPLLMERYQGAAEEISARWFEKHRWPEDKATAATEAKQKLTAILDRAFRRPATDAESQDLLAFVGQCRQQGFGFEASVKLALQKILLSPKFLFRIEKDGPIGRDREIDDFELAARLSFFLWSSIPDEELTEFARKGRLSDAKILAAQIKRMLADEKIRDGLVGNFAAQWLQTRRVREINPDPAKFPKFGSQLRAAMAQETAKVVEFCIRRDRPILELLSADFTFVNERLARHYGIEGVQGETFQQVKLNPQRRRGILTHAGILAMNAHPTRTSPVKRGKWILEVILGTPPPPPLPGVPDLEQTKVEGSLREQLEQHRSDQKCAACHERMDPLGLAFENYDSTGRWREEDRGRPIDPSGELPDGTKFAGAIELVKLLREKHAKDFRAGLAENMLVYALGRKLERYDRPPLREIVRKTQAGSDRFSALILAIAESEPFRYRRNPERVGIEKISEAFDFTLSGNPDQSMVLRVLKRSDFQAAQQKAPLEVHTLKPLVRGVVYGGEEVIETEGIEADERGVYKYPVDLPLNQKVHLLFLKGLLAPGEYGDDFLMPVAKIPVIEEPTTLRLGTWDGKWTSDLKTNTNPRPGTIYSYRVQARLNGMGKQEDRLSIQISIGAAHNRSVFDNSGPSPISVTPKPISLERVGIRKTSQGGSWAQDLSVIIKARNDLTVHDISPIRFIRPKLGLSRSEAIQLKGHEPSEPMRIFNAQEKTLTDFKGVEWTTIVYGVSKLTQPKPDKQPWNWESDYVGARLIGEDAARFQILGEADHLVDGGSGVKLIGSDGEVGLAGGKEPEVEEIRVKLRDAVGRGSYRATLRIVTQTAAGTLSTGKPGEPKKGLYYVDIPVTAEVK